MSESQGEREEQAANAAGDVGAQEAVRPFQEASVKYLQATMAAQEDAAREAIESQVELQRAARHLEQEAFDALAEATKRHLERMSQQPAGGPEEMYFARLRSQLEYEQDLIQVYADAQARLSELSQRASSPGSEDVTQRFASRRQEAYQQYLSDLQEAWASTSVDPATMKAIASHILCTLNV
jgi:hypothetical protein